MSNETTTAPAPASVDVKWAFGENTPVAEVLKLIDAGPLPLWIQDRDKLTVSGLVGLSKAGPRAGSPDERRLLVDALVRHRADICHVLEVNRVNLQAFTHSPRPLPRAFDDMCVEMMRTAHFLKAKGLLRSMENWAGPLVAGWGPNQTAQWISRQLHPRRRD